MYGKAKRGNLQLIKHVLIYKKKKPDTVNITMYYKARGNICSKKNMY